MEAKDLFKIERYLDDSIFNIAVRQNRARWNFNYCEKALRSIDFYCSQKNKWNYSRPAFLHAFPRKTDQEGKERCMELIEHFRKDILLLEQVLKIKRFLKELKRIRESIKLDE